MVLRHHEGVGAVNDPELVVTLSKLIQVLLLVLAIATEPLVVAREVALSRNDVGLKVALVLDAVRSHAVLLMGEAFPMAVQGRRRRAKQPAPEVRGTVTRLILPETEELGSMLVEGGTKTVGRPRGRDNVAGLEGRDDQHPIVAVAAVQGAQKRGATSRPYPGPRRHNVPVEAPAGDKVHIQKEDQLGPRRLKRHVAQGIDGVEE
eukprot:10206898-Alexandrium_andersonii.AAC.1